MAVRLPTKRPDTQCSSPGPLAKYGDMGNPPHWNPDAVVVGYSSSDSVAANGLKHNGVHSPVRGRHYDRRSSR